MMFKVVLVFACAVTVSLATNEWKEKILKQEKLCQEDPKTRLSEEFLVKLRQGHITDDPNLGAHCVCMGTHLGLMDEHGKINEAVLRSSLEAFIKDSAELDEAFSRCNKEKESPEKTALGLWRCTTTASRRYWDESNAWKARIVRQEKKCQEDPKSRLSEEFLVKLRKGEITEDPNLGAHVICMATHLGMMESNGKIATSVLRDILASFIKDGAELEGAFSKCNEEKETPEKTALHLWRCTTTSSRRYWTASNQWKQRILREEKVCQDNEETQLSQAFLDELRKGHVTEDPKLGVHCVCVAKRLGLMHDDGRINTDELWSALASFMYNNDELDAAFKKCNSQKDTPEQTAVGLWRCTTEEGRRYWD